MDSNKSKYTLPPPTKFTGHPLHLETFIIECEDIFEDGGAASFPTDKAKIRYMYHHMEGDARAWYEPYRLQKSPILDSYEVFLKTLREFFVQPIRKEMAQDELMNYSQGNQPLTTFLSNFHILAQIAGYDELTKLALLRNKIRPDLQQHLKEKDGIDSYEKAVATLQRKEGLKGQPNSSILSTLHPSNSPLISTAPQTTNFAPLYPPEGPAPMVMAVSKIAKSGYRPPLTQEEKDRRKRLGLCDYCSDPNHTLLGCPSLKDRQLKWRGQARP